MHRVLSGGAWATGPLGWTRRRGSAARDRRPPVPRTRCMTRSRPRKRGRRRRRLNGCNLRHHCRHLEGSGR
eukprot:8012719-Lingulodinium_polyedra.AAC.1